MGASIPHQMKPGHAQGRAQDHLPGQLFRRKCITAQSCVHGQSNENAHEAKTMITIGTISRGYYIGVIVDSFAAINEQIRMRNRLHLYDLTVHAENYFRDVLNILLKAQFVNFNEEKTNAPGLDLGCKKTKLGVQVTSSGDTAKVNETLKKITSAHLTDYKRFVVLVLGKKQGSYSIDPALAIRCHNFKEKDIWDLNTLSKKTVGLEIDDLRSLYEVIDKNTARLRVELEVPDEAGKFPTNDFDKWEPAPKPKMGDGKAFIEWTSSIGDKLDAKQKANIRGALTELASTLGKLPRVTREFYAMLHEKRANRRSKRTQTSHSSYILYDTAKRIYAGDLAGELGILEHAGLLFIDGEDQYEQGPAAIVFDVSKEEFLASGFVGFVEHNGLTFRDVIGKVDLSAF